MRHAMDQLAKERHLQMERYEDDHKSPEEWLAIIAAQLGKAAQECPAYKGPGWSKERLRQRLVQVGATAIAALEDLT